MELLKAPGARITGVWDIEVFMEEENGGRRPKQLRVYLPSRAPPAERHPNALPRSRLASPRRLSCLAPAPARLAPPRPCPPSTSATPTTFGRLPYAGQLPCWKISSEVGALAL